MPERLVPARFRPPESHRTSLFTLRRQRLEDAPADHEAVMASKAALRVWCDGDWPADDFSLEENRVDLAEHIADADRGVAFGYTIWAPDAERVLGSVYLEETAPFLDAYRLDAAKRAAIASCDVRVEAWLRSDADPALEPLMLAAVRAWLREAWPFRRPCWGSRRGMSARRRFLEEIGLERIVALTSLDGTRRFFLHAEPAGRRP